MNEKWKEKYDDVGLFSEGLAWVRKDGKEGFVNKKGNIVVPLEYDYVGIFSNGKAWVEKNGKECFIDKEGNVKWCD